MKKTDIHDFNNDDFNEILAKMAENEVPRDDPERYVMIKFRNKDDLFKFVSQINEMMDEMMGIDGPTTIIQLANAAESFEFARRFIK